jgi:hypothetical protein
VDIFRVLVSFLDVAGVGAATATGDDRTQTVVGEIPTGLNLGDEDPVAFELGVRNLKNYK